ncbi:uncharacterized protein B0I36DRAFT_366064 [Microdochium trichocladiopsis]|uniref:Solute carrier family 40 protein n=1 Tax=Microdochium trichocladiopsis TaxID=1682393 RepID=A0A9P8Y0G8_9PEZI|nr:uncharacterized protein B0I36DRAFT_366064 [Microdochium trichocladiopsis]KAH7026507.1 hypothetical protein B0I36DRAFT_366064 [Microdochium trichocladiopsis]
MQTSRFQTIRAHFSTAGVRSSFRRHSSSSSRSSRTSFVSSASSNKTAVNSVLFRQPSIVDLEMERQSSGAVLDMLEPRPIVYWGGTSNSVVYWKRHNHGLIVPVPAKPSVSQPSWCRRDQIGPMDNPASASRPVQPYSIPSSSPGNSLTEHGNDRGGAAVSDIDSSSDDGGDTRDDRALLPQEVLGNSHHHHDARDMARGLQPTEPPGSPRAVDRTSGLTRPQAWNLYLSHALSTWNARGYEFAAVLFTAAAMIIIYFAMIMFSSSIGSWVDQSPSRLRTLLTTIVCNRGSVIVGSLFWLAILSQRDLLLNELPRGMDESAMFFVLPTNKTLKGVGFGLAICCGIAERLSASGNLLSMERDWVPTVAARPTLDRAAGSKASPYDLTHLNAVMRRIDLVCKLFSPIVLSLVISFSGSTRAGVLFTGLTSSICIPIEMISARSVWRANPALQQPKQRRQTAAPNTTTITTTAAASGTTAASPPLARRILSQMRSYPRDFAMYFTTPSSVWIPSLALAMLHFNMLTWRATFITYLITVGYSLNVITAARTVGSLFEITSTVITPRLIVTLGRTSNLGAPEERRGTGRGSDTEAGSDAGRALLSSAAEEDEDEEEEAASSPRHNQSRFERESESEELADRQTLTGLQRVGLWGITWQIANTIPVVLAIWIITADAKPSTPSSSSTTLTATTITTSDTSDTMLNISNSIILFSFLSLSRLGVWVFDLTTQQLTQTLVPPQSRSSFAGVENSITNVFELAGAMASIAFPDPRQYPYLASASLAACVLSWALYAGWVRRRRGHLVHCDKMEDIIVGAGGGRCLKGRRR